MEKTDEYREARAEVREVGEDRAERTRDVYRRIDDAFDEYREDATGHGEFGRFVEFQNVVIDIEESVEEEDIYRAGDIERALSHLDANTLHDKHFRRARGDMEDVRDFVETYERYVELGDNLRDELSDLERRADERAREIRRKEKALEKARRAEGVDVSRLREAVEGYNERVREGFETFVRDAPAVDVARLGERTHGAPLVDDAPIERGTAKRLARYVDDETVDRVLELADSSDAKLSHYVDDPDGFRDAVPRTYFETADGSRFELSYDPEGVVRRRAEELVSLVRRFADDETVMALRRVRDMAANGTYGEMRRALVAREEAGADVDAIRDELDELRDEKERAETRADELRDVLE
ncbi:MAG: hypothetical protein ACLFSW_00320 [Halobacteriales archaeon]